MEVHAHTARKKWAHYVWLLMKKLFFASIICFTAYPGMAQNKYADSLKSQIENATNPIEKFDLLNKLGEGLFSSGSVKVDSAFCNIS